MESAALPRRWLSGAGWGALALSSLSYIPTERILFSSVMFGLQRRGRERGGRARVAEDSLVILVVEDDHLIQSLVEEALSDGGFESAIVATGEEAVSLLKDGDTRYRVLVTDIDLGGRMPGWDVAKAAREIDPDFPVIYMTGAAADQWASHGVPNSVLLTKPFAPAQLVTAISNLLNTGTPPT
jgi:CheY-like chemotaxis protein